MTLVIVADADVSPIRRQFIKDYPVEILAHSIKYDYPILIDETASRLLFSPIIKVAEKLTSSGVLPWVDIFSFRNCTRIHIGVHSSSTAMLHIGQFSMFLKI